ncbi:MAG TPA: selenocysteine-specific translation elongation factor [Alphaproteobacteria bacterium]|nr:selenocysteine-specific translation elongation factor [Alphaproteobacteria bacterium]
MKQVVMGTAGHIDHGKTQLVKALTGIDTDRLKEEKERGITIDLGFAHLTTEDGTQVGVIDVPGHERFVRNMLAGVGGIDLVMLVIAADEGVMPQTREHLAICQLLEVKEGLVALTKTDLVDADWLELVVEDTREFLKGTFLEGKPIVPVSAKTGSGLDDLKKTLQTLVARVPAKHLQGKFRLPIDRVFTIRGFGTVVTGTLFSGSVRVEDRVEIYPKNLQVKVRGLQIHNQSVVEAVAGQRTAVNLQGIEKVELTRGDVLGRPGEFIPTFMLDATLQLLADVPRPLRHRARVRLHLGTSEIMGRVILLDRDELSPGDEAYVQFRLEAPAIALPHDRYVIRSYSPVQTIGGGMLLDVQPAKHRRGEEGLATHFQRLAQGTAEDVFLHHLQLSKHQGLRLAEFLPRTEISASQLRQVAAALHRRGEARAVNADLGWYLHEQAFRHLTTELREHLATFHRQHPLRPGTSLEDLRTKVRGLDERVCLLALDVLQTQGEVVVERDRVRLASHQIALDDAREQLLRQVEAAFLAGGYQPPRVEEVFEKLQIGKGHDRELLQVLVDQGRAVRLKENVVFHRDVLQKVEATLVQFLREHREITPVEFKDLLGVSRKYAIPLLEYFDSQKLTIRVGDKRVLRGAQ